MRHTFPTAVRIVGIVMLLVSVSGCAGPGFGRWCYWHPYRCGR